MWHPRCQARVIDRFGSSDGAVTDRPVAHFSYPGVAPKAHEATLPAAFPLPTQFQLSGRVEEVRERRAASSDPFAVQYGGYVGGLILPAFMNIARDGRSRPLQAICPPLSGWLLLAEPADCFGLSNLRDVHFHKQPGLPATILTRRNARPPLDDGDPNECRTGDKRRP